MRSIHNFISYNLKRVFLSPKPYIMFLVIFIAMRIGVGGARVYLTENDQMFQAVELFVFALSSNFFQILLILGLLFLIGDAPFLTEGMSFQLIRTSRGKWLAGQILSCVLISAIYLIVIAILFVLLFWGQVTFQNEWSNPVRLAAQINVGGAATINIQMGFLFFMDVIRAGTPYAMFGLVLSYNLLLYSFLCLVVISCNLKSASGIGFFGVIIFLGVKLIQYYVMPYKWLWYLSPCSVVCFGYLPISTSGIVYTLTFLAALFCCTAVLSFQLARRSDLLKGEYTK